MADPADTSAIVHYEPAPPALGSNLVPGAHVRVEGLEGQAIVGIVVPGEPSTLHERLPLKLHAAIERAALAGAQGNSGALTVDLTLDLPW